MPMKSGQRTVVILLSITLFLLVYYLLTPRLRTVDITEHTEQSTEESTVRINPLRVTDGPANGSAAGFLVNDSVPLHVSTTTSSSSATDSDLTGQSPELDQAHSLQIKMYGDRAFLNERYRFVSSEKVFLVMEFNRLEAGEHTLRALWKSPTGQLINTSGHSISLAESSLKHRSYFWLKLMRNGLFTEALTGKAYKGEIHGRWSAEIYFNGARITTQHFMILN
jgi:hypothetical protein